MMWRGVPAPTRAPLAHPWALLAPVLGLAAALVLATPVTSWRTGADEGAYFGYAARIAGDPGAFPALFREYLDNPVFSRLFTSPARLTAIVVDAIAIRLGGLRYDALAFASLLAFLGTVVVAFVVARLPLGDRGALVASVLVATSPLGLGMARRALTDSLNATLVAACLALVIHGLTTQRGGRWWAGTSIACTLALLGRELNLLLVPMSLVLVTIDAIRHRRSPSALTVVCVSFVPIAVAFGTIALAAGDATVAWRALVAVVSQAGTNDYALTFGAGPWYRYLVDFLLLSPATTVLYVVWIGYALATRLDDDALLAWTLVPALFVVCAAPFAKFVRWALFLDVPIRLGVAALLVSQTERRSARVLIGFATLALAASQLLAFHRLFVAADLYDPTSADLLVLLGFVPLTPLR